MLLPGDSAQPAQGLAVDVQQLGRPRDDLADGGHGRLQLLPGPLLPLAAPPSLVHGPCRAPGGEGDEDDAGGGDEAGLVGDGGGDDHPPVAIA